MNFDKLFEVASSKGIEDLQIYFVDSNEFEIEVHFYEDILCCIHIINYLDEVYKVNFL